MFSSASSAPDVALPAYETMGRQAAAPKLPYTLYTMRMSFDSSWLPEWGRRAADAVGDALGSDLCGLYVFGSAVTGGLRRSSDLDLLAVITIPAELTVYRELARRLLTVSRWCPVERSGRPVELTVLALPDIVPWRYPALKQFQFGEWLRPELERGEVPPPAEDPDLAIILESARTRSYEIHGPPLAVLTDPIPEADLRRAMADTLPQLIEDFPGDERNVILTLARIWATLRFGAIVPKDDAAARMLEHVDPEHRFALDLARRAYRGEIVENWRPSEQSAKAFVAYAQGEIRLMLDSQTEQACIHPSLCGAA